MAAGNHNAGAGFQGVRGVVQHGRRHHADTDDMHTRFHQPAGQTFF